MMLPPRTMPCPTCGQPAPIRLLETRMDDDALNMGAADVWCREHGVGRWRVLDDETEA